MDPGSSQQCMKMIIKRNKEQKLYNSYNNPWKIYMLPIPLKALVELRSTIRVTII